MDIDELQQLWQLVSQLHDGKKYGGRDQDQQVEYINHIGSVVFELFHALEFSPELDGDLMIKCGLLHDAVEDTSFTLLQISKIYGSSVAAGVAALTKDLTIGDKMGQMQDSLQRIRQQPREIWAVKMADRICNLFAPPFYWDQQKKLDYLQESNLIYKQLCDASPYLARRLKDKMVAYMGFVE
ncbi:hypothetical protein [uncultured Pedobacter sp.]|uniref:hypothetical protein n=1 Tax=uncultured Pedobacter sp. TaxID=246139 RepID=UPI0026209C09|nr:hypothetical protein [uncultured Pedobacter sp.]